MDRDKIIVKTSVIGILVNLVLVAFKATIGIMVNSIAITLDAVNNLTDALSSIITIIGTKLAGRAPDKDHPYGYGRIEYFSSVIIAVIVLLAGITALEESVPKIFNPVLADYTFVSIFIIAVAVVVKFLLGRYVKGKGKEINSQSLVASGSDALFDAVLSLSTVVAAIISYFWNISLEGILGTIIAFVIIKAAIEMLSETLSSMIGTRVDSEITDKVLILGPNDVFMDYISEVLPNLGETAVNNETFLSFAYREIGLNEEVLKTPLKERCAGFDVASSLLQKGAEKGISFYFFGSKEEVGIKVPVEVPKSIAEGIMSSRAKKD